MTPQEKLAKYKQVKNRVMQIKDSVVSNRIEMEKKHEKNPTEKTTQSLARYEGKEWALKNVLRQFEAAGL